MKLTPNELVKHVVKLLDDKKAQRITVLDISKLTQLGDYFIIASGTSTTQVKALAAEIDDKLSKDGVLPKRIEGTGSSLWILMDYYDVIIHIFNEETRDFYGLERLWADAKTVDVTELLK